MSRSRCSGAFSRTAPDRHAPDLRRRLQPRSGWARASTSARSPRRFDDVREPVLAALREVLGEASPLTVHDVGVSDGTTSVELYEDLKRVWPDLRFVMSDGFDRITIVRREGSPLDVRARRGPAARAVLLAPVRAHAACPLAASGQPLAPLARASPRGAAFLGDRRTPARGGRAGVRARSVGRACPARRARGRGAAGAAIPRCASSGTTSRSRWRGGSASCGR